MSDESCRKRGASLRACAQCSQFKEPIKYICLVCGEHTLEQFHRSMLYGVEKFQTQSPFD